MSSCRRLGLAPLMLLSCLPNGVGGREGVEEESCPPTAGTKRFDRGSFGTDSRGS